MPANIQVVLQQDVDKVVIFGTQDEKFYLTISPKKLAGLGLNVSQVLQAIADQNAVTPAGSTVNGPSSG